MYYKTLNVIQLFLMIRTFDVFPFTTEFKVNYATSYIILLKTISVDLGVFF